MCCVADSLILSGVGGQCEGPLIDNTKEMLRP